MVDVDWLIGVKDDPIFWLEQLDESFIPEEGTIMGSVGYPDRAVGYIAKHKTVKSRGEVQV